MALTHTLDWPAFYRELADRLLPYKNNRQELVVKVYQVFDAAGINMPKLEENDKPEDLDPFTFFGLFNKNNMKEENRIKIMKAMAELFFVKTPVPTSFDGVPALNPFNAAFYSFRNSRGEKDMDELWEFFESALRYADNPSSENQGIAEKYFDIVINKAGNGISKITIALFWIAPDTYLSLDIRNRWYIYESGKIPKKIAEELPETDRKMEASKYFEITEKMRDYLQSAASTLKDFKSLSYEAWRYSLELSELKKSKKKTE